MNTKWILSGVLFLVLASCASTRDFTIQHEVYDRIQALKPDFASCWRQHQPDESIDALTEMNLEGTLQANGKFKYVDVDSVPQATKSTQACIEKIVTDELFSTQPSSTQMTFKLKF